jgi:hypothetical protein
MGIFRVQSKLYSPSSHHLTKSIDIIYIFCLTFSLFIYSKDEIEFIRDRGEGKKVNLVD